MHQFYFKKFTKFSNKLFVIILIINTILSSCSKDETKTPVNNSVIQTKGSISGTVKDGNNNLVGAIVILKQTGQIDKSFTIDSNGNFEFKDIEKGSISLICTFSNYITQTISTSIIGGQNVNLPILMGGDLTILTLIPDPKFEGKLISLGYDSGAVNGSVPTFNISKITNLNVNDAGISDLTGIQDFIALENLDCSNIYGTSIVKFTSLDISKNIVLKTLNCSFNKISTLDISKNILLTSLKCSSNLLSSIDVSSHKALTLLWCDRNPLITNVDVTQNLLLTDLGVSGNPLINLDISKNLKLLSLICGDCKLINLDVTKNISLKILWCYGNKMVNLDITKNIDLITLFCDRNDLTNINLSFNTNLVKLSCTSNKLNSLNIINNTLLDELRCDSNFITVLDLSKNVNLKFIGCSSNKLTTLDISKNVFLAGTFGGLICSNNLLTTLNVKNGNNLNLRGNFTKNSPFLLIAVDDVTYSNTSWQGWKDPSATFVSSL